VIYSFLHTVFWLNPSSCHMLPFSSTKAQEIIPPLAFNVPTKGLRVKHCRLNYFYFQDVESFSNESCLHTWITNSGMLKIFCYHYNIVIMINKLASIVTGKYLISDLAVCSTTGEEVRSKPWPWVESLRLVMATFTN
jgi:hypothetical protein